MLKKDIKKVILETKEKKEKLLIEQKIVENRIMMIFESKENVQNFHLLSEGKKQKMAKALFEEISYLQEQGLLNEQLWDILKGIFGNSLGAATETLVEPLINSLLGAIGLGDSYFGKFIVSFITTNPLRLAKALPLPRFAAFSKNSSAFLLSPNSWYFHPMLLSVSRS